MSRLAILLAVAFVLAGCSGAPMMACSDADPTGICANSHSQTYEGGR